MATFKKLIDFFRLDETETAILQNEIKRENTKRIFYLTLVAVPASILHILYFWANLNNSSGTEHLWRILIIFSHVFIALAASLIGFLIYIFSIRSKKDSKIASASIQALIVFLLIGGSAIATFDQLVTPAINPFIATCMISAMVILIRPLRALAYYTGTYIIFHFSLAFTQTNPDILLSNRVNGMSIAGIGLCLSFILWQMNMVRIKQNRIIEKQQKELLDNYNKLMYYSEELKESNTTKDKLLSVIAHDLRNPLSSLISITDVLTEDFEIMSHADIRKTLTVLNKEAEQTYELLINLLEWSGTQRKKLKPNPDEINLNQLVTKTFNQLENSGRNKNITLINEITSETKVFADPDMLQSVMKNLLANGIKFTRKGGRIHVSAAVKQKMIEISVQDSGIGMKPEQLKNLFKLNNGHSSPGTENEKGTGLGLQICKEFVELNGGEIWVQSEIGKGSTFVFSLPAN